MMADSKDIGFLFDPEKCTECRRCMIECSLVKTEAVSMRSARLTIKTQWPDVPGIDVCRFDDCSGKPCIDVCPVEAIVNDRGFVLIDPEECTGCGACVDVCPYKGISMSDNSVALKCDFCGGDPACVKECVTEALGIKEV